MFNLLNPIWLSAIAALGVPVVIHLWNIRPGKVLKVGSISLIEASSRKSSRSFDFLEVLLLILRCLFLLLLAFLLAQPIWSQLVKPGKVKGWVLIPRQNIHQVYGLFKPKIDSLTKAGYELHYFNKGFAGIDSNLFKTMADSGKAPVKTWALLNDLAQQIPVTLPVYAFAPNTLNNIVAVRPQTGLNLQIKTYTPADSISKWIQHAALVGTGDAVKITTGDSRPSGTIFTYATVQETEKANSEYQINIINGQPSVSFKTGSAEQPVAVDTATLRIALFGNPNDVNYLSASLNAIKQFTNRKIQIVKFGDAGKISAAQDWIFWLSEHAVPADLKAKTKAIFAYEPGKAQAITSWIAVSGNENISLTKHIATKATTDKILWQDGFGEPVLSVSGDSQTAIYHFYSHFDPAWNDMVWSDDFAKVMFGLLIKDSGDGSKVLVSRDKRIMADEQLKPATNDDETTFTESDLNIKTELAKAFWIALVLLLLTERLVAYRTKNAENNG